MTTFTESLSRQSARLAVTTHTLAPTLDDEASRSLTLVNKVNEFLAEYQGSRGFSEYHPAFVVQMTTAMGSLELHKPLSLMRGNGRIATVIDHTKNTGNGMRRCADSLVNALLHQVEVMRQNGDVELNQPIPLDFHWIADNRTKISYPEADRLPKSTHVMAVLQSLLDSRRGLEGVRLSKEVRKNLLLTKGWTEAKIISYTIELLARAFAYKVDPDKRLNLVEGDVKTSLEAAFKSLPFA